VYYSYNRPFEGNHNADLAHSENKFDTPDRSTSTASSLNFLKRE